MFPQDSQPFNEPVVNHHIFVQKPSGLASGDPSKEEKDPDVWDPPTPKVPEKKKATKWGAGARG